MVKKMEDKKPINIVKVSLSLSLFLLITKTTSFIRDLFIAQTFGATTSTDVFFASNSILMVFVSFILSPFAAAYIPIAMDYYLKKSKVRMNNFFGTIYGIAICLGIIMALFQGVFIKQIIKVVTPGFSQESTILLIKISYIQLPIIFCTFIFAVNSGNLRLLNKFKIAEISNVFAPLACILYLLIKGSSSTIVGLSTWVVVGYFVSLFVQLTFIKKSDIEPKLNLRFFHNEDLIKIVYAMAPFMIDGVARELNTLIDKAIGSLLPEGSITMLSYASKITVTQVGLISTAISLVVFSQMSKYNSLKDNDGLRITLVQSIKFVNLLIIPLSVLTIVLRLDIIKILFGRGAFDDNNIKITANIMMFYSIGMFGFGMQDVLMRGMHATKHRKFPAMMSVLMVLINISLNLFLYKKIGTYGLALASSISVIVIIPILYIYLCKKVVSIRKEDKIIKDTFLIVIASLIMGIVAFGIDKIIIKVFSNNLVALIGSSFVAILVYLFCLFKTKNEIVMSYVNKRRT